MDAAPNSEGGDEMPVGGGTIVTGVLPAMPDAGRDADAALLCGVGFCGSIGVPAADATDDGVVGLVVRPDSGTADQ